MKIIKIENIDFSYKTLDDNGDEIKNSVLENFSLEIEDGDFIAILGHNGSGKSTLAKLMNGLLTPEEGEVFVKEFNTKNEEDIWKVRQNCGMVFQNPDNQIVATIVEEDVAFGAENLGVEPSEIKRRVDFALKTVGMEEYKSKSSNYLSGGQKQRIAIAGVLAMKPSCIILDEATAMLDPIGRKEVLDTIIKLNKEENITIILITHYMEEAVLANKVVVINNGQINLEGTPREVFENVEKLKEINLGVPEITELSYNLNKKGIKLKKDILTTKEFVEEIKKFNIENKNSDYKKEETKKIKREKILEVENLDYVYGQGSVFEKKALENINMSIDKGEFLAVIGHTGSGKSTLIQHLNGLLIPTSGKVLFNNKNFRENKKDLKILRQKVGLVFQYPEYQLFETTVFKDVAFGPGNLGLDQLEIKRRVENALDLVGIPKELFEKSPFELSGGQKRRVAIAGVLAMEPEVLILDEPAAGLDPKGRREILEQIKNMHEKLNISVILVSHSMEDVSKYAERIIVISNSKIVREGSASEIFQEVDYLESIGLAAPQISYLIRDLNKIGFNIPTNIYSLDEATNILYSLLRGGK